MSEKDLRNLQGQILGLEEDIENFEKNIKNFENNIKNLEFSVKNAQSTLNLIKEKLTYLKDIAWDRNSKKESSSMYKVLNDEKKYTKVKSNVGEVKVDREFMEKEIKKHLDDPALRGMVTSQEMLSFPKVAKNVDATYDNRYQGYTWQVKANDDSIINYGERDFGEGYKLLTSHSKTERGERGQLRREFNDRDFHNSVYGENSTTNLSQSQELDREIFKELDAYNKASEKQSENKETLGSDDNKGDKPRPPKPPRI